MYRPQGAPKCRTAAPVGTVLFVEEFGTMQANHASEQQCGIRRRATTRIGIWRSAVAGNARKARNRRLDVSRFVNSLMSGYEYRGQAVHIEAIPAREASYGRVDPPIVPALWGALGRMGISSLYTHQAEAVQLAREGRDIVVVTSTARARRSATTSPSSKR